MSLVKQNSNKLAEDITKENNKEILQIIKGSILAIVLTAIFMTIYAAILSFTNISENTIIPVVIVLTGISLLIGSSISTISLKRKGMLNGSLVGLTYMLILYFISSCIQWNFSINLYSVIMVAVGVFMGMVGGIIGVNLGNAK